MASIGNKLLIMGMGPQITPLGGLGNLLTLGMGGPIVEVVTEEVIRRHHGKGRRRQDDAVAIVSASLVSIDGDEPVMPIVGRTQAIVDAVHVEALVELVIARLVEVRVCVEHVVR